MKAFENPARAAIDDLLRKTRTIAVIGISSDPSRPSHSVSHALQRFGYRIVPVNPTLQSVLGETCYPTVEAAVSQSGASIDLVDVFRLPQFVAGIVDECIRLKLPALWLQDGVIDEAAAQRARDAGIFTVMNRCTYRDRAALADL